MHCGSPACLAEKREENAVLHSILIGYGMDPQDEVARFRSLSEACDEAGAIRILGRILAKQFDGPVDLSE